MVTCATVNTIIALEHNIMGTENKISNITYI